MTVTIYAVVLLAACVLALLIYKYDMYDREPWLLVLLTILLGGASAWLISYVEDWIILRVNADASIATQALIASTCEESCKIIIILFVAFGFRRWFNDPMDGIVYGALAGLGFALEESRFYLDMVLHTVPRPTKMEIFGQEAIRLMLHFLTGGLDGFGIGLLWANVAPLVLKIKQARLILIGWLGGSLLIHFLWDYACGLPQAAGQDAVYHRLAAVLLMIFALILFGIAVSIGNVWSAIVHPPDGDVPPLVRWPFTLLLRESKRDP